MTIRTAILISNSNKNNLFRAYYAKCQDISDFEKILKMQSNYVYNKTILTEALNLTYQNLKKREKIIYDFIYFKEPLLDIFSQAKCLKISMRTLFRNKSHFEYIFKVQLCKLKGETNGKKY